MPRNSHILNAASNLLGIALLIVTGINITDNAGKTYADEAGIVAALLLAVSCIVSYLSIRSPGEGRRLEAWADKIFLSGLIALLVAVSVLVFAQKMMPPNASIAGKRSVRMAHAASASTRSG